MKLTTILGRHKVADSAAPSLLAWIKRITEIDGKAPEITEIYRSREEQARLYAGWIARLPGFNPAYSPNDKRARHIHGLAIDWGFQGRSTAHKTAAEFGWEFNVVGEEWHAEKVRSAPSDTASLPPVEFVITDNEDDMFLVQRGLTGELALIVGGIAHSIKTKEEYAEFRSLYNDRGVKLTVKGGATKVFPAFESLGRNTDYAMLSETGWVTIVGKYKL